VIPAGPEKTLKAGVFGANGAISVEEIQPTIGPNNSETPFVLDVKYSRPQWLKRFQVRVRWRWQRALGSVKG
jgi:hypothetical protein